MSRKSHDELFLAALNNTDMHSAMKYANKNNIDLGTTSGTAITQAVASDNIEAVKHFLSFGADPEVCDPPSFPLTAFDIWRDLGNQKLDILIELVRASCKYIEPTDNLPTVLSKLCNFLISNPNVEDDILNVLDDFTPHFREIWYYGKYIILEDKDTLSSILDKLRALVFNGELSEGDSQEIANYVGSYAESADFPGKQRVNVDTRKKYPNNFNGSRLFKRLRRAIGNDHTLHHEARAAACLIGTPSNPFKDGDPQLGLHEFPHEDNETYHRSKFNPFVKAFKAERVRRPKESVKEQVDCIDKIKGADMAHLGLYHNALEVVKGSNRIRKALFHSANPITKAAGESYRRFLLQKRRTCQYVVNECDFDVLTVGFYHDYPCIMMHVPKSANHTEGTHTAWVEFIGSYFVGVLNYLARSNGFSLRITRRASFGFLTPHIAITAGSVRIDPGIVPNEYSALIIEALVYTNNSIKRFQANDCQVMLKGNNSLPKGHFLKKEPYKKYKGKNIPDVSNYIDFAWACVEKNARNSGKSSIQNFVRSSEARQAISSHVEHALIGQGVDNFAQAFSNAFVWGMKQVQFHKKQIKTHCRHIPLLPPMETKAKRVEDDAFWEHITYFFGDFKLWAKEMFSTSLCKRDVGNLIKELGDAVTEKNFTPAHRLLIEANELLFAETLVSYAGETEDDIYGSDSDCEAEINDTVIYAKKTIVENGTRAILDALLAGSSYLRHKLGKKTRDINIFSYRAYYEIPDALRRIANIKKKRSYKDVDILSMDMNPCITDAEEGPRVIDTPIKPGVKILVLDNTSATEEECHEWIQRLTNAAELETLVFASSGFKNEQNGGGRNHYGTIRIFTKNRDTLSWLYNLSTNQGSAIRSGISHAHRRTLKALGFTPRNRYMLMPGLADQKQTRADVNDALRRQVNESLNQFISELSKFPGAGNVPQF